MMIPKEMWPSAAVTIGSVLGLLVAEKQERQALKWAFKPLAALGFVAAAFSLDAQSHAYGQAVIGALVLSLVGDICLIPNQVGRWFLFGLIAFLLGHLGFAVAFLVRGVDPLWVGGSAIPAIGVGYLIYRWLSPNVSTEMIKPVQAYVGVITIMLILAIGTSATDGHWLIAIAATGFWLSDISVANGRFKNAGYLNRLWGIPLYFVAQLLFAATTAGP